MPFKDPKKAKQNKKDYYRKHRTEILRKKKEYYQTHKKRIRKNQLKYRQTHPEKTKNLMRNWRKKHPEQRKRYCQQHPEKIKKINAKHRKLGFIPLNESFEGSHAHHIDFECIVYIPKELHRSVKHCVFTGLGMTKINGKVFEWLEKEGGSPN